MKKTLALVLCVLLCASVVALAEDASPSQTVTSVTGLFTVDLPEGYAPLSTELIQSAMDKFGSKELEKAQYDISALQDLDLTAGDYYYSDDFARNFNVQIAEGSGITLDMLETQADQLGEILTESYVAFGLSEKDCETVGVEVIGETPFLLFNVTMLNQEVHQYITVDDNETMYTLTFTNMNDAERAVVETFHLIEQ
ncbi:MAG: hypothetical protein Q4E13_11075 [Clostridia bacterium]|nr:hypothetical protein [Clostridia bacterium]